MFVTLRRTTLVSSSERYRGNKRTNNGSIELPSQGIISDSLKGASSFLSQHTLQSHAELWKTLWPPDQRNPNNWRKYHYHSSSHRFTIRRCSAITPISSWMKRRAVIR